MTSQDFTGERPVLDRMFLKVLLQCALIYLPLIHLPPSPTAMKFSSPILNISYYFPFNYSLVYLPPSPTANFLQIPKVGK